MAACNRCRSVGLKRGGGGAAAPRVRPHPGGPASRPPLLGQFLNGPEPHPRWCSAQVSCVGGLLFLFPSRISALCFLLCAFCLVLFIFHLYLNMIPEKHVFSNTSGTMSIVHAYVSKVYLFLLFWTIIGNRIQSLVTANTESPLYLGLISQSQDKQTSVSIQDILEATPTSQGIYVYSPQA